MCRIYRAGDVDKTVLMAADFEFHSIKTQWQSVPIKICFFCTDCFDKLNRFCEIPWEAKGEKNTKSLFILAYEWVTALALLILPVISDAVFYKRRQKGTIPTFWISAGYVTNQVARFSVRRGLSHWTLFTFCWVRIWKVLPVKVVILQLVSHGPLLILL